MPRNQKALLNYTTEIEPAKTAGEIVGLLAAKGAKSINMDYQAGEPVALTFRIDIHGIDMAFRLPCNYEGAERALRRLAPPRYQTTRQAKRVAWRIVKDWVEAQLALVELGQAELGEVFFHRAITSNGQTLFQRFVDDPSRLLAAGSEAPSNVTEGKFGTEG